MDDLIARWVAGDAKAAEVLYRTYFDRVKEFVISRGATFTDAEDVAQEALIAGLEGLKAGRRPDRVTLWLLGIAKHVQLDRRPLPLDDLHDVQDDRSAGSRTVLIREEMRELLRDTLGDLGETDREVLDLLHRAGLSKKEIAGELRLSMAATYARCDRAHERVREALTRHFTSVVLRKTAKPGAVSLDDVLRLRPSFRQVIIARHFDGGSDAEAMRALGLPEATYRARLQSAYEMLRCTASSDFTHAREEKNRKEGDKRGEGERNDGKKND